MEKFAVLTGNVEGQKKYHQIAEETKRYWNDTFTDKETGITKNADGSTCDVQGSYSIGLNCDVFADAVKEKAFAHLERTT